jgi:hypothetical protein
MLVRTQNMNFLPVSCNKANGGERYKKKNLIRTRLVAVNATPQTIYVHARVNIVTRARRVLTVIGPRRYMYIAYEYIGTYVRVYVYSLESNGVSLAAAQPSAV